MNEKKTYAEEIIKKKKEFEQQKDQDVYSMGNDIRNGFVVIKYEKLDIEEKVLLDGKIKMCIPKEFKIMGEEQVRIKYPGDDRPLYIYTNEDTTVNITFNIENGEVSDSEIEEVRNELSKQIRRLYPSSKIEDIETIKAEEKTVSYFSFDIPVLDGEIYNFMFFAAIKSGLLMGTFNCNILEKKQWGPVIKQMIATLKENEEKPKKTEECNQSRWLYGKNGLR